MSDTPQGPDWWQASNDKWYPPPRPDMPGDQTTVQAESAPPGAPLGPPQAPPSGPPGPAPDGWGAPSPAPGGFAVPPGAPDPYGAPPGSQMDPYGAGPGMPPGSYGPYDGMPGPQPGQANRMPLFIVLGVLGLGALFAILYLVLSGDDGDETADPDGTTDDTLAPEDDPEQPLEEPPDDEENPGPPAEGGGWDGNPTTGGSTEATELSDGLTLVEYGYSNVTYALDPAEFRSSWGLVVENTGSDTAENFLINVTLYDADGGVIDSVDETIYILPAGEKMGIGETLLSYDHGTPIADMEVQYGGKEDFVEDKGISGSLTTSNVQTEQATEYSITTTFTVESSYDVDAEGPASYVILRNTSGEIIGGAQGYDLTYIGAGSSSDTKIDTLARFDEVDIAMDQTEAYVDFGY